MDLPDTQDHLTPLRVAEKWRRRPQRALPFVLMDADAIRELYEANPSPIHLLGILCQPGHSTIFIPRMVMNEILRYKHKAADGSVIMGAYDFYLRDGALDFYTGQDGLPDDARRHFSRDLASLRQGGKLRCYASLADLNESDELSQPKGGIVIVDTASAEKATPPSRKGVKFLFTSLPGQNPDDTIQFTAIKKHAGDKALSKLAGFLCRKAPAHAQRGGMLVISNDIECKQGIADRCRERCRSGVRPPAQVNTSQLLHTLEYTGQMNVEENQQMVEAFIGKRLRDLKARGGDPDTLLATTARASYTASSPRFMNQCLDWLEATGIAERRNTRNR